MTFLNSVKNKSFSKNGMTLVETLVYAVIFAILIGVIVGVFISLSRAQRHITATRNVNNSAVNSIERISREIRNALSIDEAGSTFDTNPGVLSINTTDEFDNLKTVEFYVSSGVLRIKENGVDSGPVSVSGAVASSTVFRLISNGDVRAIRTELIFESGSGEYLKSEKFYDTTIVRGGY